MPRASPEQKKVKATFLRAGLVRWRRRRLHDVRVGAHLQRGDPVHEHASRLHLGYNAALATGGFPLAHEPTGGLEGVS